MKRKYTREKAKIKVNRQENKYISLPAFNPLFNAGDRRLM